MTERIPTEKIDRRAKSHQSPKSIVKELYYLLDGVDDFGDFDNLSDCIDSFMRSGDNRKPSSVIYMETIEQNKTFKVGYDSLKSNPRDIDEFVNKILIP
ncbi:MAG: hypothetical protein WC080_00990 [Patescibacteria group bacterium]